MTFALSRTTSKPLSTATTRYAAGVNLEKVVFGFFVLLAWQLGGFFKRNFPRRYTLDKIPPDVLPKVS